MPCHSHVGLFREKTLDDLSSAGSRLSELYAMYNMMGSDEKQAFKRHQERSAKAARGANPSGESLTRRNVRAMNRSF